MTNNEKANEMYAAYNQGYSLEQVAKMFGVTRQSVFKMFKRRGFELRSMPKPLPFISFNGFKYTLRNTGYYGRTEGKRTLLHRDVWRFYHGVIPKGFDVHHIDRDRSNNDITNLELMDHAEHARKFAARQNQFTKGRRLD